MADTPFDCIESAQEYVHLLVSQVDAVRADIRQNIEEAVREGAARRLDALQIVDYKLKKLAEQLGASRRILNDLRMLRRLLVADRDVAAVQSEETGRARA